MFLSITKHAIGIFSSALLTRIASITLCLLSSTAVTSLLYSRTSTVSRVRRVSRHCWLRGMA
ncbi:hypothetical protein BDW75DRAFT_225371 [Aspergillus navahoensis]